MKYRYFDIVSGLFIAVLLISNVSSSAKIVDFGVSLLGLRLTFDAGTLLFPVSYIFGDILTEIYGYHRARRVIWLGFFSLALMSVYFFLVGVMPGEQMWQGYAGDSAYAAILGGMSSGGLMLASLSAYLAGELSNSAVMDSLKKKMHGRMLWVRTIGSTLIGQALDTTIFVTVACFFDVFPWEIAVSLIVANYVFKVGIEVVCTPLTYGAISYLKGTES